MLRANKRHSDSVAGVTRDTGERALDKKDLGSLESRVTDVKRTLLETFNDHCNCSLYTIKYY